MFDDDPPNVKSDVFPRNLESLSVADLEHYIQELEAEISRAKEDINKKKAVQDAASSFFKS